MKADDLHLAISRQANALSWPQKKTITTGQHIELAVQKKIMTGQHFELASEIYEKRTADV